MFVKALNLIPPVTFLTTKHDLKSLQLETHIHAYFVLISKLHVIKSSMNGYNSNEIIHLEFQHTFKHGIKNWYRNVLYFVFTKSRLLITHTPPSSPHRWLVLNIQMFSGTPLCKPLQTKLFTRVINIHGICKIKLHNRIFIACSYKMHYWKQIRKTSSLLNINWYSLVFNWSFANKRGTTAYKPSMHANLHPLIRFQFKRKELIAA